MANENIGSINCQYHEQPLKAAVRRDRKDKLYIYCDECGIISPRAAKFQTYIKANMTSNEPTPGPEKIPTPGPENKTNDLDGWF